ncbi:MAG: DNA-directed RNA polymerase subunit G [Caldisphaera sp.]|jgi:DNA-directed RNA polymerase subunit G|nr:DNA-directed RNA polymerase subunit G [Caldisphaera sp.]PMP60874.1 MAG: hypothetical protein C0201_01415 [Caldisphaera sp.]PMP89258.1 MAG: hypothetical protein C0172_00440 [Caldisphaera sp.]
MFNSRVEIKKISPSKLQGAKVVEANNDKIHITFDLIENLFNVNEGDKIELYIDNKKPENIESYDFCAHGYLVKPEDQAKITILSLWGILFQFDPPIGLNYNEKYYLCLRKS